MSLKHLLPYFMCECTRIPVVSINAAQMCSFDRRFPDSLLSGLSKYYKDTQTTQRHAKSHKDTQRFTKTRKDTQRRAKTRKFLRVFVRLCVSLSTSNVFLLPLRVFVCLCASLPVFARLCVSLRSLGVFAVFR